MSSHTLLRTATLVGIFVSGTAAHAAVECARSVQGHRLTTFSLFDGDPSKQVELAPASKPVGQSGFINTWPLQSSAGLVAVCRYDRAPDQVIPLPAGLSVCRAEGSNRQMQASCQ